MQSTGYKPFEQAPAPVLNRPHQGLTRDRRMAAGASFAYLPPGISLCFPGERGRPTICHKSARLASPNENTTALAKTRPACHWRIKATRQSSPRRLMSASLFVSLYRRRRPPGFLLELRRLSVMFAGRAPHPAGSRFTVAPGILPEPFKSQEKGRFSCTRADGTSSSHCPPTSR